MSFTLTKAHLLLQCLHSLCTYMDIFTTDYLRHTAETAVVETLWQLHTFTVINSWFCKTQIYCRLKINSIMEIGAIT